MDKIIQIFLSYAYRDLQLKDELLKHLELLQKQDQVTIWSVDKILPGENGQIAISRHLDQAQIILLLISADFLSSKQNGIEVDKAIERQREGKARVIPIILRPAAWQLGLPDELQNELQVLPDNGKPLTSWASSDLAYLNIVEGIRAVVTSLAPQ